MVSLQVPEKTMTQSEDIGAILKKARLQSGMSLEEVSRQTFIKLHYLYALEEGQLDQLPAPVYTSGYIRQYARLLNLDEAALIRLYHAKIETGLNYSAYTTAQSLESLNHTQFTPVLSQRNGSHRIEEISASVNVSSSQRGASSITMNQDSQPVTSSNSSTLVSSDKRVVDTIEGARKEALAMRHQTEQYADNVLSYVEAEIQKTLTVIRNGRNYLKKRMESYH